MKSDAGYEGPVGRDLGALGPRAHGKAGLALVFALIAALTLVGAACKSTSSTNSPQNPTPTKEAGAPVGPNSAIAQNISFQPPTVTIAKGTEFLWTNEDSTGHTVTSGTPPTPSGTFDQSLPSKGATAKFMFTQPGTFTYFCKIHNQMTGTVVVQA